MNVKKANLLILTLILSLFLLLTGCPTAADPPVPGEPTPTVSTDASLSALGISDGTLTPGFHALIDNYSVTVANSIENIGITPTTGHASASIKVDGTTVPSGSVHSINSLIVGDTSINIVVTAEDGTTTQDYNVTVTRSAADSKDITSFTFLAAGNAALFLDVSGVITEGDPGAIAVTVPFGTVITSLVPTIVITGVSVSPDSGVSQAFTDGVAVPYTVTDAGSGTKDYNVTVNIATNDAKAITSFILGVAENPGAGITTDITGQFTGFDISLDVPYNTNLSALVPTIGITGVSVSPASGAAQAFTNGVAVTYTVTAADASTQDYGVTVNLLPSTDATLSSLTVSTGTLTPAFAPGTYNYTVDVANTVTSVDITAAATDGGAAVTGDIGTGIVLSEGINNLTVTCTAADGTTILDYTLAISRAYAITVTGTLTIPDDDADGADFWVLIDDDTDGFNGYIAEGYGTWGTGTTEAFQIDDVPPGTYYILAGVDMDSTPGPSAGDYFGYYGGVDCNPPGSANAVVPIPGPVNFNFDLPFFPGGWTTVSGTLTLFNGEDASGKSFDVGILDSLVGDMEEIAWIEGTWMSGSSQNYEIPNVPEGDYYLYAVIDWNDNDGFDEAYPDFIGLAGYSFAEVGTYFATGVVPGPANVSIPSDGSPVTVDVDDIQQIPEAVVSNGTITIVLTGAGEKAGGMTGFGIYVGGSGYIPGTELATGGFIISGGGTGSAVAVDGDSNPVIFTGGTNYDIGIMIDDNGNGTLDAGEMAGMSEGEVVDGNITVTFDYTNDLDPYVP